MSREVRRVPMDWRHPKRGNGHYIPMFEKDMPHGDWYIMYENVTEGTPLSPVFSSPGELAHWLSENGETVFANHTASYEVWIAIIERGWYMPIGSMQHFRKE